VNHTREGICKSEIAEPGTRCRPPCGPGSANSNLGRDRPLRHKAVRATSHLVAIARKRRWTSELKVTAVAYERTGPILQRQRRLGWEFSWAWRSRKFAGAFVRELDVGFKIPTAPSIPYRSLNLSSKYTTRTGFHASRKIAEPISGISPPAGR
jgi:hypothetical protein